MTTNSCWKLCGTTHRKISIRVALMAGWRTQREIQLQPCLIANVDQIPIKEKHLTSQTTKGTSLSISSGEIQFRLEMFRGMRLSFLDPLKRSREGKGFSFYRNIDLSYFHSFPLSDLISGIDRSALIYTCIQRNGIEEAFSKKRSF